jgi:Spy/CpxP family protein refolding chaperone
MKLAPRVQAVVLLLLVATASALAGIVGDRLVSDRQPATTPASDAPAAGAGPWRWEPRADVRYGERLYGALDLSVAQRAAIDSIVAEQQVRIRELNEEVRPRFRAIAEQTRGRIEGVLTEEQRDRLRQLREERARTLREGGHMRGSRPDRPDDGLRERRPDDGLRERARRDPAVRDSLRREWQQRRGSEGQAERPDAAPATPADTLYPPAALL